MPVLDGFSDGRGSPRANQALPEVEDPQLLQAGQDLRHGSRARLREGVVVQVYHLGGSL